MTETTDRHIEAFLEMLSAERGAATNTLESYRHDLEDCRRFVERRNRTLAEADSDLIRLYLKGLAGRSVARATSARRLSALRQFYRFLHAEGLREDDPTAVIDSPRRERPLPKILSEDEVRRLLDEARRNTTPEGVRAYALLEILYATGLRVSELVGIPLSAGQADERFLVVRGKGGKERMVPLNEAARDALKDYAGVRPHFLGRDRHSEWLFPSRGKSGHLTRQRFGQYLKKTRRRGGDPAFQGLPPCAASRLCQSPAGARCGPARRPADARARRHRHHRNLHTCPGTETKRPRHQASSAGRVTGRHTAGDSP